MKRWIAVSLAAALAAGVGLVLRGQGRRALQPDQKHLVSVPRAVRGGVAAAPAAVRAAPAPRNTAPNFNDYKILLSQSMFVANRPAANAAPAAAPVAATLSLKGISQEDARFTAFIEDSAAGRILELKAGDALAHGRVTAIHLTDVEYEEDGKKIRVSVGQSLGEGVAATAPQPEPAHAEVPLEVGSADDRPAPVGQTAEVRRTAIAKRP
ncbi:MAG: hypothetical protein JWN51_48 [Phycisphaerales bacterium]|jgi:hypothetical protein|nr:hypothetical protein [Phycisphaerales bacterium]